MEIRDVEKLVDKHHEALEAWRYPQSALVWGVLRHIGQVPREFGSPKIPRASYIDVLRVYNNYKRGAAQVARWASNSTVVERDWLSENETVLDVTVPLLEWAVDYARIASCFIAYSRGLAEAEVDAANRNLRFYFARSISSSHYLDSILETDAQLSKLEYQPPVALVRGAIASNAAVPWLAQGQWPHERQDLAGHKVFQAAFDWAGRVIAPELVDGTEIGALTLGDLRRIWASLWVACASFVEWEEREDRLTRHNNVLPAAVMFMPRSEWIDRLVFAAGVHRSAAEAALELLTFNAATLHSSLTSHPFAQLQYDSLLLSPRVVYHADPRCSVGWLLNARTELRSKYGSLCDAIQRKWVLRLRDAFRTAGWSCQAEFSIDWNGQELVPDLVARDREGGLLVADFKFATVPIEPRQVSDRLSAFDMYVAKGLLYAEAMRRDREGVAKRLGEGPIGAVFPAIIYRWPMTMPIPEPAQVLTTDADRILTMLARGARTVASLIVPIQTKSSSSTGHKAIMVGEWTIDIPIVRMA